MCLFGFSLNINISDDVVNKMNKSMAYWEKIVHEHYHEVTDEPMVNWHRDELVHEHTPGVGSLHQCKQQTHHQLVPGQMIIGLCIKCLNDKPSKKGQPNLRSQSPLFDLFAAVFCWFDYLFA